MVLKDFECSRCGKVFEEAVAMDCSESKCSCGGLSVRVFLPSAYNKIGPTAVINEHYNEGLGEVVKGRSHLKQLLKEKNLSMRDAGFGGV